MKILMVGPFPEPITGMSLANDMLRKNLSKTNKIDFIDTNSGKNIDLKSQGKVSISKIASSFLPITQGASKILFGDYDVIYITPAQSFIGFMKYTPFMMASTIRNKPYYMHFHGGAIGDNYRKLNSYKQKIMHKFLCKSSGIVVLGTSLRAMFDGIIPQNKVYVCENGIESQYILSKEELSYKLEHFKVSGEINLLYLSNLMKSKGIIDFLDCCIEMKNENIKFHADTAGIIEKDIENEVYKRFEILGECITYHGVVSGEAKRSLLQKSNVFCLPTYYPNEGQPISILEAMGAGCAIVTTNQGGISDIFKDKLNGYLCYAKNSKSIKEAVYNACKDYENIIFTNNEIAADNYSEFKFAERIINIVDKK